MKEYNDKVYNTRDVNGKIKTQPKNFYSQPYKKGFGNTTVGHLFEPIKYQVDPFQRPNELDINERANHKSKILDTEKHYVTTVQKNVPFVNDRTTYGTDRPASESKRRNYNYAVASHSKPWKNSNPPK